MGTKSAIPGVSKPFSEMTGIGKVTFISATIGTVLTAIIGLHQVGSYGIEKLDERTSRVVVASPVVKEHVINLVDENAFNAVKIAFDQRGLVSDIRSLRLELRMIKSEIRDINGTSELRSLTAGEREDLEELKNDRQSIKQEIKELVDEIATLKG